MAFNQGYYRRRRGFPPRRSFVRRGRGRFPARRSGYSTRGFRRRGSMPTRRHVDLKFFHQFFNDEPSISNAICRSVSAVPCGIGTSQRLGASIRGVSMYGYVTVCGDPAGTTASNYGVRVGFAQWLNEDCKEAFTASQLMLDPARPGGPFNVHSKGSFKVLWSRYVVVYNKADNPNVSKTQRFRCDLREAPLLSFDAEGSQKNPIFWFTLSDDANATAPPTVEVDVMFRFSDV